MRLLKEPGLLVLTRQEFEESKRYLHAAGYRWLPCGEGFETARGKRHQWQSLSGKWVSDNDESGRYYLDLECLPCLLGVSNASEILEGILDPLIPQEPNLLARLPFDPANVRAAIKDNEAWPDACG